MPYSNVTPYHYICSNQRVSTCLKYRRTFVSGKMFRLKIKTFFLINNQIRHQIPKLSKTHQKHLIKLLSATKSSLLFNSCERNDYFHYNLLTNVDFIKSVPVLSFIDTKHEWMRKKIRHTEIIESILYRCLTLKPIKTKKKWKVKEIL